MRWPAVHAGATALFAHTRRQLFMMYYDRYGVEIKRMSDKKETRDGTSFKMMPFECSSNGMHGSFQWAKVR